MIDRKKVAYVTVAGAGVVALITQLAMGATVNNLFPASDGTYTQWTPKSGSTHYTMVDETTCNGTTDYVRETTVGQRDSYGISLSSVPNGGTVTDIAIKPCASRHNTGTGSSAMDVFYRWNGADSSDAGGYALPTGITPTALATTTFSGLSLIKSSTSTFEVGAVYTSGNKGVRLSQMRVQITYTVPTPPNAPSNASAVNISSSSNSLTWNDNSTNEESFYINRALNGGGFSLIATTTANTTSYTDNGLTSDRTYSYQIRAVNSAGSSGYSNTTYAITAVNAPLAPSNLLTFASSSNSILLYWADNSTNEEGFQVERSDVSDTGPWTQIATTSLNAVTYLDPSLATGTTYHYQVRAFNVIGASGYSNTSSKTLP